MNSLEGKFIVLEGTDGTGKTTQADLLHARLVGEGYSALRISTPGDSYRNDRFVREYNQTGRSLLGATTLAAMAAADRLRTVDTQIKPHLDEGGVVVCDRYFYSAAAYFSMRGADMGTVNKLHSHLLEPDFGILCAIDSATRALRLRERATTNDWEERDMNYLDTVQSKIQEGWRNDFLTVDSRKPIDTIRAEIDSYLGS